MNAPFELMFYLYIGSITRTWRKSQHPIWTMKQKRWGYGGLVLVWIDHLAQIHQLITIPFGHKILAVCRDNIDTATWGLGK